MRVVSQKTCHIVIGWPESGLPTNIKQPRWVQRSSMAACSAALRISLASAYGWRGRTPLLYSATPDPRELKRALVQIYCQHGYPTAKFKQFYRCPSFISKWTNAFAKQGAQSGLMLNIKAQWVILRHLNVVVIDWLKQKNYWTSRAAAAHWRTYGVVFALKQSYWFYSEVGKHQRKVHLPVIQKDPMLVEKTRNYELVGGASQWHRRTKRFFQDELICRGVTFAAIFGGNKHERVEVPTNERRVATYYG